MTNPFAPTATEPAEAFDVHVVVVAVLLLVLGVPVILMGAVMVPTGLFMGMTDPEFTSMGQAGAWFGLGIGVLEFLLLGTFGGLYAGAGAGLLMRRKWGWVLGVVVSALWMSSCCAPFGIYGLWALLREPVRKSYGF